MEGNERNEIRSLTPFGKLLRSSPDGCHFNKTVTFYVSIDEPKTFHAEAFDNVGLGKNLRWRLQSSELLTMIGCAIPAKRTQFIVVCFRLPNTET